MRMLILLVLLASTGVSPLVVNLFNVTPAGLTAASWTALFVEGRLADNVQIADMDGNGSLECIDLDQERLSLGQCDLAGNVLWQSPEEWRVEQALMADLNRDGSTELVMLVTRPFTAWPVDSFMTYGGRISDFHDAKGMSSHLILIGWKQGRYREVWAGSALYQPLTRIAAVDIDSDGYSELLALEGEYDSPFWRRSRNLTLWQWNGFGFSLVQKLPGNYSQLVLMHTSQQNWIIASQ